MPCSASSSMWGGISRHVAKHGQSRLPAPVRTRWPARLREVVSLLRWSMQTPVAERRGSCFGDEGADSMKPLVRPSSSPVDRMIDAAVKCTKCGAGYGRCDCWTQCRCGWSYERGGQCRNPVHTTGVFTSQAEPNDGREVRGASPRNLHGLVGDSD